MVAPLRLGMVGGGRGAFIGGVHRMAARLDGRWALVAGALSSDPARARDSAADLGLDPSRSYADYRAMAAAEAERGDRIDAVAIVTPNDSHAPIARAFLQAGIAVICDKPLCTTLADAADLVRAVDLTGLPFLLTHNYTGHPLVRQMRAMISAGDIGTVRVVQVEYAQDWLTTRLEDSGHKQAGWRTDPAQAGAGALGDLATHAHNVVRFVTGAEVDQVSADLASVVAGRRTDDDVQVRLRLAGGARGTLWATQVAPGNENGLRLRVYGDQGGLEWHQEHPNQLRHAIVGQAPRILFRAGPGLSPAAAHASRVPAGHPEGYLEAFAQLYRDFADVLAGTPAAEGAVPLPDVRDGFAGVAFVLACQESSAAGGAWVAQAAIP